MKRRDLSMGLLAAGTGSALIAPRAQAATCTATCYPRTAAEVTADVLPTNTTFPELDVQRYGAGGGIPDDAVAFSNAAKVARINGGTIIVSRCATQYVCRSPINFTNGNIGTAQKGFSIRGEAAVYCGNETAADILFRFNAKTEGVASGRAHAFDCSGTSGIHFSNLVIATDPDVYPETCFFLARNSNKDTQIYAFDNVMVIGHFSRSLYFNYGSEQEQINGCTWYNNCVADGARCLTWTAFNLEQLKSPFITIATGQQSCIDHKVMGGSFLNQGSGPTNDLIRLESSNSVRFYGSWFCSRGRSYVFVDTTKAQSAFGVFSGITGENSDPLPRYGFYFGESPCTVTSWTLEHSYIPSAIYAVHAGTSVILDNFHIKAVHEQAVHGLSATVMQGSVIDGNALKVKLATSKYNLLIGQANNYQITNRIGDNWVDTRIDKSWTGILSDLTIKGYLTTHQGQSHFHGNLVTVTQTIVPSGSISAAPGAKITGLPADAADFSAQVQVTNLTTAAVLCGGYVHGTSIFLGGFAATSAPICVTATYFAASAA